MVERTGAPPDTVNPDHPVEGDATPGFTWDQLLYRLYGEDDELLYIGRTNNIATRFKHHARAQPWWREVRRSAVETLPDFETLCEAEKAAIIAEGPRYNIAHAVKRTARPMPVAAMAPWRGLNRNLDVMSDLLHESECMRSLSDVPPEPGCDTCGAISWACLKIRADCGFDLGPGLDAAAEYLPHGVERYLALTAGVTQRWLGQERILKDERRLIENTLKASIVTRMEPWRRPVHG